MNEAATSFHPLDMAVVAAYLGAVVFVGIWVGKFTKTTSDFFMAGQRFSWWLVAISCAATLVGSYSFVQYAESGFRYGMSLMYPYTNEWFVLPLFLGGWLPIIYYSRVQSIPEYFERRFDRRTRIAVLLLMLVYLEVYIGINLLAIGTLLNGMFGWNITLSAAIVAILSGLYLHAGGQTSVIITDLFQGLLLLAVGVLVFVLGVQHLGGFDTLWSGLPAAHRLPFAQFNHPAGYHAVGDFWNDAIVGTFAFYMINQGVLMRFLSARSVHDGRKAMLVTVVVIMPIAALAVTGAGWVGRAMVTHEIPFEGVVAMQGVIDSTDTEQMDRTARNVFVGVAKTVCQPGVFGLVIAAVIAALMSTLDTLITAVTAICINDVWRPLQPGRDDAYFLRAARLISVFVTVIGLMLIPVFSYWETIYQALSMFTSLIIPPLVIVVCLGITWRRFSARAAFWTLVLGSAAMVASLVWPILIVPFSHGVDPSMGFPFLRGLYGLVVCGVIAVAIAWGEIKLASNVVAGEGTGLDLSSLEAARIAFKGGQPNDKGSGRSVILPIKIVDDATDEVRLPASTMHQLEAEPGDLVYVSDRRWWLGGLRSLHARLGPPAELESEDHLLMSAATFARGQLLADRPIRIEKHM